jgi:hypothetical protein
MATALSFEYDEEGDILYISKRPPYAEQETEPLTYNVVVRRNPQTHAIENVEVLFFTRWLLKGVESQVKGLGDLFTEPRIAARA